MGISKSILFSVSAILLAGSAQAVDIVSVNFTDGAMTSASLVQGTYGIEPAANWNNTIGNQNNLTNDSGVATTVDVTTVRPNGNALWPDDYTNTVLYGGIRENLNEGTRSSATISDLNANFPDGYKVIAYLNGSSAMNAALVTDGTTTNYYKSLYTPSNFSGALTKTDDEDFNGNSSSVPVAQYAVFGSDVFPLTADSITLTMDALLGNAASLCGFQIVGAEPPTLPAGTVFYDDFENYSDLTGDGVTVPSTSDPFDWNDILNNPWTGRATDYWRPSGYGSIFARTNATTDGGTLDAPADSTGGVAAKVGFVNHGAESFQTLTVNTGIKFNINTNYTVSIRAKVKNKENNTASDATAVGQMNLSVGYYNVATSNYLPPSVESSTNLTATNWTDLSVTMNGARLSTNALGNDLVVRLSRGAFSNSTDYLSWVDYIRVDVSSPVDDWLASQGLTNVSWTADADGDGVDNFTEYATGGDPNDPGSTGFSGPSFIVDVGGGTNRFAYVTPRQVDYWANGVDYYLERTTDLVTGTWVRAGTWVVGTGIQAYSAEFDARTNYLGNIDVNDQQFLRLRVSHPGYNP